MLGTRIVLATAVAAAASGMAVAQQSEPAQSPAGQSTAATTATQPPAGTGLVLQEVTITAEKRTERLSDVPVSASVVSGNKVSATNSSDISDLNKLVPSVNLNGSFNGRVPMGIRGISSVSNEGTVGLSSGVAIMIDGVPVPSDSMAGNDLEDVQSVEVLKGPQATLGGRTAATGMINIVTRKPTPYFTGDVGATATSDGEYRLNGFLAGPITHAIDFSLAAWGDSRKYPIRNIQLDKSTRQRVSGGRVKLLIKPNDDLDITLMGHYGLMTADGDNFVYKYISPGAAILVGNHIDPATGQAVPNVPFLSASALVPLQPGIGNRYYASPIRAGSRVEDKDASLLVSYRLGELTLGSTTAYQHETEDFVQDLFLVNAYFWNELTRAPASGVPPFYNSQDVAENVNQFSQEFKLASPTDWRLSYLVGAFYSDTKVHERYTRQFFPAYDDLDVTPDTATLDAYARTTWRFRRHTSLVTGIRYNYDSITYRDYQILKTFAFGAGIPTVIGANQVASGSHYSSVAVGDVSLKQQFTPNIMAYATYARGYSPGAFNTVQQIYSASTPTSPTGLTIAQIDQRYPGLIYPESQPTLDYVGKETVDHFEIGLKSTYFEHRVRVDLALFDTKYKNFQIQNFDLQNKSFAPPLILESAGGAETRGAELDTNWAATRGLRINFSAAYVDAFFTDYNSAPCYYPQVTGAPIPGCSVVNGAGVQDLKGKPMPNAPKFKFDTDMEERIPLSTTPYGLVLGANYSYRTSAEMLADQNPQAVLPGFGILDLSAGVEENSGKYALTAFVNNVLDKHYMVDLEDFWSSPWGKTNVVSGQPARDSYRYYGLRFTASF